MFNKMLTLIIALAVVATSVWYTDATEAQQAVVDGLVSFWTLDETDIDGDTVKDIVGGNDGTMQGKPKIVPGKIKQGLEFDGGSDFVDCGGDDSLNLTEALTIELWMMPSSAGEGGPNAGPICKAIAGGSWSWQLRYNAPGRFMGFQFNAGGHKWVSVKQKLKPKEWYHITGTYDGSDAVCYLNGVEKDKISMPAINSSNDPILIGQDGWGNIFDGVVDEVRIYDRALSESEVKQNYNLRSKLALTEVPARVETPVAEKPAAAPLNIGVRRELFVDDFLIERMDKANRVLHRPQPREVVLTFDRAWEAEAPGYVTVLRDGDRLRMYYRALPAGEGNRDDRQITCLAESDDGLHWRRPKLGLFEFHRRTPVQNKQGLKQNNIVWRGSISHNVTPFRDENPDCPDDKKYKAVGGVKWFDGGLWALGSPDGINWRLLSDKPLPFDGNFDSQNVIFWDAQRGEYRAYWRDHRRGDPKIPDGRDIRTAVSRDFINWSEPQWLNYEPGRRGTSDRSDPPHQFYTNGVQPYHRAPHLLFGFPMRYIDRGWTPSTDALPNLERRRELAAKKIGGGKQTRLGTALTDVMFMSSRDGLNFNVWPESFIRPSIQRPGSWFYGDTFKAWGLVETESAFDGAATELSLYVNENSRQNERQRIRRYSIRVDGFVSVHASLDGGELVTKPLVFEGNRLELNFSTSAGGTVRVEIQNKDGEPIDGFTLADCHLQYGDQIDRVVSWKSGSDVGLHRGRPVRLRFELKDADLYSFRFVR